MTLKRLLQACFMLFIAINISLVSFGQDKVITGKVTDSKDGSPVVGASILAKGSKAGGTVTSADGAFSITVPPNTVALIISYVGYGTQEIAIGNKTVIDASLSPSGTNLNEVVVVGYGSVRKKEVTSAITNVTPEQFNKGNVNDVAQLLQGKVAGLSISRAGGDPNAGFVLRLRGLSTLGANTQPLIVVDGQIGADINTVDPNDIQAIDVLKDGSAAAIYGTRGSAGVIIITTKQGKSGAPKVDYNVSVSFENATKFTDHMTAEEFVALGKGTNYGANTDWNKEITKTGFAQMHNLNFSGGTAGTTYSASLNYRKQEGIAITTGFDQVNGRLNLKHRAINNKLVFNIDMSTTKRNSDFGFPDAFKYATIYNPTAPVYSTDPLYDLTGGGYYEANFVDYSNPVAMLRQNTNTGELTRFNLTGSAEYEILKGLKFLIRYGQQSTSFYGEQYSPRKAFISRGFVNGVNGFARGGYAYKNDNESFNQLFETIGSYQTRLFDKLDANIVGGYSYQDFLNKGYSVGGGNFVTDESSENLGAALDFLRGQGSIGSYKNASKIVAFFGRINLNWDDFIFFSASLRREGSTVFGANNKWGSFPAVSAGVDIKRIVDISFVNTLKLRGSFGITGALPTGPYQSFDRLTNSQRYYTGNDVYQFAYGGFVNSNPDLKWEKKQETDIGLDFAMFNNRLTGTIDYFIRKTDDLIFNVTVASPPALFTNTWKNIGLLDNQGIEVALNYDVIKSSSSSFSWTTGGQFSSYDVFLAKLDESLKGSYVGATNLGTPGQEATQLTRAVEGEPIGLLYGYKYMGVDANGKYLFADKDGKPVLQTANPERGYIGNGLPKFEWGWTNTLRYKNFDLNFFLRGSVGHEMINTFRAFYENPNVATSYNVVNTKYFNPAITDAQIYSSLHVEKATFVKLDNATLGYNVPVSKGTKFGSVVRNMRFYVAGQNLFVITDYTGVDPEVRYQDGGNVLAPGIDRRETWVYTRTLTIGLNVGF
jgi:iron complex outermembrane receptor protein